MADFLVLQTLDGRNVFVNPAAIVSISEAVEGRGPNEKLLVGRVHCAVTFSNGKFVTVVESCDAIRKRLESK